MATTKRAGRTASKRQLRVGEELRHIISSILAKDSIHDVDVAGSSVTVTEVNPSPDMRNATVYVASLGGVNEKALIEGLNRTSSVIQGEMARHLTMKFTPRLSFKKDESFEYASHIDSLIRKSQQPDDTD